MTPQAPLASAEPQQLAVRGERFLTGLTLQVAPPAGASFTIPSSSLQSFQSESFVVSVVLASPGNHTLTIRNATGEISEPFVLTVQGSPTDERPVISAVVPGTITRSPTLQSVTVQGANFVFGLTVSVVEPDGLVSQQTGTAIVGLSSTSFQLSMVFGKVGAYSLRVINPTGESSNTVNVIAGQ